MPRNRKRHYLVRPLPGGVVLAMREGRFDPFGPSVQVIHRRVGLATVRYRLVGVFDTHEAACDAVREIEYANRLCADGAYVTFRGVRT